MYVVSYAPIARTPMFTLVPPPRAPARAPSEGNSPFERWLQPRNVSPEAAWGGPAVPSAHVALRTLAISGRSTTQQAVHCVGCGTLGGQEPAQRGTRETQGKSREVKKAPLS